MPAPPMPLACASPANARFQASKPPGPLPHCAACAFGERHVTTAQAANVAIASSLRLIIQKLPYLPAGRFNASRPLYHGNRSATGRSQSWIDKGQPSRGNDAHCRVSGCTDCSATDRAETMSRDAADDSEQERAKQERDRLLIR